ncbi:MAG: hypothetical protein A3K19_21945 [Lentisphaerae bacterium RIFOXYB12_FULL_65_16]|nr:MAG: hypothetical protein A3K18_04305 [Lentisphaerae bacterium RIFOXYA12_64_32]OGV93920.1 MAG: hypothetical protein A3K19_21945 [Lentisphaerae bacterium RIFOXYB12_FULL_65_16]
MRQLATERVAGLLAGLHALAGALLYAAARHWDATACLGLAGISGVFAGIALLALLHARTQRLAREEAKSGAGDARGTELFDSAERLALLEKSRALQRFERFFNPAAVLLATLAEVALAWGLWTATGQNVTGPTTDSAAALLPLAVFLLVLAAVFFLVGRFAAGLSRDDTERLLCAPAGNSLATALLAFTAGGVVLAGYLLRDAELRFQVRADLALTRTLAVLLVISALDRLLSLLLRLYRPHGRTDEDGEALYASRLSGGLVQPGSVIHSMSTLLDYQFGVRISESWFWRFVHRALLPLVALQLAVLLGLSCLAFVNPGEEALLETFGAPATQNLQPGLHFKMPWPVQALQRVRTHRLRQFVVGVQGTTGTGAGLTDLWTDVPEHPELFLAASTDTTPPQDAGVVVSDKVRGVPSTNLLATSLLVQYRISDVRKFVYDQASAEELLRKQTRRCALAYFASHDGLDLLRQDREAIGATLTAQLREAADGLGLGVDVVSVGLLRLQPPPQVVPAFRKVIEELQNRESRVLEAQRDAGRMLPESEARAAELVATAQSARVRRTAMAGAVADVFRTQRESYHRSRNLYTHFLYFTRLEKGLAPVRKVVVATENRNQVLILDFKKELVPELLDLSAPVLEEKRGQ